MVLLLVSILLCSSCEEEFKIDTSDFESKLVVNSLFTHDVPWSISVTNSKNILDNNVEISTVEDALVEIYSKDGRHLYDLYLDENGFFSNDEIAPSYSQSYTVKVSAPGYPSAVAQDKVPSEGKLTVNKTTIKDTEGNVIDTEITFFIGKEDEETYLIWELYNEEEIGENGIEESKRNLTSSWLNQLYSNPRSVIDRGGVKIGKTINGNVTTTLETLLQLQDGGKGDGPGNVGDSDISNVKVHTSHDLNIGSLGVGNGEGGESGEDGGSSSEQDPAYELRVMTISKELHDYYNSLEDFYRFDPGSTEVSLPKVHSNVRNGYGIFASFHEQVVTF